MSDQFIGDYRIIRKIGAGGMAKVFLAEHRDIPSLKVILKILSDPSLGERFRHEADKLALLDGHPSICRIKHFFSHGEETVIAMEYIDGVSLDDRIKNEGRLALAEAISITNRVLDTVQFAHEKGIYHRDIKPSNIMIDQQGQVKVIDFGIAKGKSDPNLTMAGAACGTPAYMAPEQFNPREDTDYALADVYAIGTTLFQMLTGELPFKGDNEFALRDAKLFTEPAKPRSLNPSISKQLDGIILRAIDKEPSSRFESARAMKQALEAVPVAGSAPVEKTVAVMKSSGDSGPKRSRWPMLAGIVVLAAAAIGGWMLLKPGVNHPPKLMVISDQTLKPGARVHFAIAATDLDNTTPRLDATGIPEGGTFAAENGLIDWTPSPEQTGPHRMTFYAIDREDPSLRDSQTVTFTVAGATPDSGPTAVAMATLTVKVRPRGDIYVDGVLKGSSTAQVEVPVSAGSHVVRVKNDQAVEPPQVDTISLAEGQVETMNYLFTLKPSGTPDRSTPPEATPSAATGDLRISSKPTVGAEVFIDGEQQTRPTPSTYTISVGRHSVRALLDHGGEVREMTKDIVVVADSTVRLEFDFTQ